MRRVPGFVLSIFLVTASSALGAQAERSSRPARFTGTLSDRLAPDISIGIVALPCFAATPEQRKRAAADVDDAVCAGEVLAGDFVHKAPIIVVEPAKGAPSLLVEKTDGSIERLSFEPLTGSTERIGERRIELPMVDAPFKTYPVTVYLTKPEVRGRTGERILRQSVDAVVDGEVEVGGSRVLVRYWWTRREKVPLHAKSRQGLDVDGNGKIDARWPSAEVAGPADLEPVLRVGTRYVSTEAIDLSARTFVLRERHVEEYTRIELVLGQPLRDFDFRDIDGAPRRLSEFRGRYVLLDFWGTWCGPCVANIPDLKTVYGQFRDKGFEVIGLDFKDDLAVEREFARKQDIRWPLATAESVKALLEEGFAIDSYPTLILLDRGGRVVSWDRKDQPPLRGLALGETLLTLMKTEK